MKDSRIRASLIETQTRREQTGTLVDQKKGERRGRFVGSFPGRRPERDERRTMGGGGEGEKQGENRMTFDPGGPDGSGPPLQKRRGRRSTKEYIISSSSACGVHKVRANCEGSSQVFHELSLRPPSRLTPVSETTGVFEEETKIREASYSRASDR